MTQHELAPSVSDLRVFADALLRHAPAFSFGERLFTKPLLSRVYATPQAVHLPESFRGGCSFGAAVARNLSREGWLLMVETRLWHGEVKLRPDGLVSSR